MSGTAALAAARKRRATPQPTSGQFNQSNASSSSSSSSQNQSSQSLNSIKEEFPKATNPAMLLMQHNVFIQKLQKDIKELKSEFNAENKSKGPETDYKEEYLGLLEEMKEMKKVLLKVQSFSMETNLEVMKLKRLCEKSEKNEKIDVSTITLTNDIDTVV